MAKFGVTKAYRYYADRFYLDRANRDNYLYRSSATKIGLSGGLVVPDLETLDGVDLSVHAADLDAHHSPRGEVYVVGQYITGAIVYAISTATVNANYMYTRPFHIDRNATFDRIGVEITTGGGAGKLLRLGIYSDNGAGYPGSLALDAGTVDANAVAVAVITISKALTHGDYWLVAFSDGSPVVRGAYIADSPVGISASNFSNRQSGYYVSLTYAALPTTFTAGGSIDAGYTPLILLRLLSLN